MRRLNVLVYQELQKIPEYTEDYQEFTENSPRIPSNSPRITVYQKKYLNFSVIYQIFTGTFPKTLPKIPHIYPEFTKSYRIAGPWERLGTAPHPPPGVPAAPRRIHRRVGCRFYPTWAGSGKAGFLKPDENQSGFGAWFFSTADLVFFLSQVFKNGFWYFSTAGSGRQD